MLQITGSVASSCWSARIGYVHRQQGVAFVLPVPCVTPPSLQEIETLGYKGLWSGPAWLGVDRSVHGPFFCEEAFQQ